MATCVSSCGNLRVRLATQRTSLRNFNLRILATTCQSVWPRALVKSTSRSKLYLNTLHRHFELLHDAHKYNFNFKLQFKPSDLSKAQSLIIRQEITGNRNLNLILVRIRVFVTAKHSPKTRTIFLRTGIGVPQI